MQKKAKPAKPTKPVEHHYFTGTPIDQRTPMAALKFFGTLLLMAFAFLILGAIGVSGTFIVRVLINGAVLVGCYYLFWAGGINAGTEDVARGETLWLRHENNTPVSEDEKRVCYHKLKGFVAPLLGTLPLFLLAVVFAAIAQKQMTEVSVLPSWVTGLTSRSEIGDPLNYYMAINGLSLEAVLRIVIRIAVMPYVGLIGTANADALLVLEKLSPVLVLIPALLHGLAYPQGVTVRAKMHADIAANNRKRARRERRQREARRERSESQRLN